MTLLRLVLGLTLLAVLVLGGVWVQVPAAARLLRLERLAGQEAVATPPPRGLLEQPGWLVAHRWGRLPRLLLLPALALLIGTVEGTLTRHRAPLGGFLRTAWCLGLASTALVGGALAVFLCLPVPVPDLWAAGVLAAACGGAGYGLALGRPLCL